MEDLIVYHTVLEILTGNNIMALPVSRRESVLDWKRVNNGIKPRVF